MRNNHRLPSRWLAVAAAHLFLVLFGASQIRLPRDNALTKGFEDAFSYYGLLSGASNGYGFFKEIHSELKARFVLKNRLGQTTERRIETELNREAALRMNNLVSLVSQREGDVKVRRKMMASLGGWVMARHPDYSQVTVKLMSYELPSMEEYRGGRRPEWRNYYRATFVRGRNARSRIQSAE